MRQDVFDFIKVFVVLSRPRFHTVQNRDGHAILTGFQYYILLLCPNANTGLN